MCQLLLEGCSTEHRQHSDSIPVAFALARRDLLLWDVDILGTQPQALYQAQAGAVEELGHQQIRLLESSKDGLSLGVGEHDRKGRCRRRS